MKVLILQAGFNEIGVINNLKKAGHYVYAIGNQRGLVGQKYVDEYYCLDYRKRDEVVEFMLINGIDRICACCNDAAVLTAAYVAEKLGLSGYDSIESSETIAYKDKFKCFANENNLMAVNSVFFDSQKSAVEYIMKHNNPDYPIIIKPSDLSGGKGVNRCDDEKMAYKAIETAFEKSMIKHIVIEPYIKGTQHGFCTFLKNKRVIAYCSNDEYSMINPYRVEMDLFPAGNNERYKDILIDQIEYMAEKLSLTDGIFHLQYIESNGKIYIIEAMRRIIGNMYSIPASRSIDFDWDFWQSMAGIGELEGQVPIRMVSSGFYSYRALVAPKDGIVKAVHIDKSIEKYIFKKIMLVQLGECIENHLSSTVGILFMQFGSRDEMEKIMLECYDRIRVEMEDEHCEDNRN